MKPKNHYIAIYYHKYGINTYLIQSNNVPTDEEVIKFCGIEDFDAGQDEWIEIDSFSPKDVVLINN